MDNLSRLAVSLDLASVYQRKRAFQSCGTTGVEAAIIILPH